MKHYKTFGQTNGSQQDYHHPQPQYTPIEEIPMMDTQPPQHRAIRNLQHGNPEQMMHQHHSMSVNQPPQHQIVQPLSYQEEEESPCARIMHHIKKCNLCSNLYKQNSNTYLCIIVFLVLLILFLITKLIDK